ncbi:MAG: hypothetical protein HC862_28550 [Scytonema sp. RU_4_4]|nr:hypothetical protein [Scytonema sp. RU_4_4]NJR75264.1 hypothetical protein [Scytonema sp. CRU_2_7]
MTTENEDKWEHTRLAKRKPIKPRKPLSNPSGPKPNPNDPRAPIDEPLDDRRRKRKPN